MTVSPHGGGHGLGVLGGGLGRGRDGSCSSWMVIVPMLMFLVR
jgi:hypothetical protein